MGVIGLLIAIGVLQRVWKVDYGAEEQRQRDLTGVNRRIFNRTIHVTRTDACDRPIHELIRQYQWDVVFGRVRQDGELTLAHGWTQFCPGDLVTTVGAQEDLDRVTEFLGEESVEHLELDRSELDYRRIIVSNPKVAGHQLRDLNLPQQYGAVVTRVRRGDVEFLPHGDTVLELGDRIRVLTSRNNLDAVSSFFGDSYRADQRDRYFEFRRRPGVRPHRGPDPDPAARRIDAAFRVCRRPVDRGIDPGEHRAHRADRVDAALQRESHAAAVWSGVVSGGRRHAIRLCVRYHVFAVGWLGDLYRPER